MTQSLPIKENFYTLELNKAAWQVPQRYQLLTPVGAGAYGQVCSALDSKTTQRLQSRNLLDLPVCNPCQKDLQGIIGLLDCFTPMLNLATFDDLYLVTSLMGADLNNIVKTQKLSDDHVQFLIYQILRGLKYIHSAGIIHRVSCFVIALTFNEDCELKILDFGLARQTEESMTGYVATRWYRAPEIMLNWMHYNQTVDIWSVGCIMAEMLIGKPLFPGTDLWITARILSLVGTPREKTLSRSQVREVSSYLRIKRGWPVPSFSVFFQCQEHLPTPIQLLERMLDLDADERITATGALAHPYLKQYADPTDEPTSGKYDQSFEEIELTIPEWKKLVYEETEKFVPHHAMEI
ncbi:hypothetical protein ScPMuIL_007514 [Solemya velum]